MNEKSRPTRAPSAPAHAALPVARARQRRGGPKVCDIHLRAKVVTPILGGASRARAIDEVDIIRTATVRGHLRFWWRALRGHEFTDPSKLFEAESELWGQAATGAGGRSAVDVRIEVEAAGKLDETEIRPYASREGAATSGAYALWPARGERKTDSPPAPRRVPGTRFQLTLIAPAQRELEVRNAARAWLLFGGYGSRTRRGLGSLGVLEDANAWLPSEASREALASLFERDPFRAPQARPTDVPWLAGASLHAGRASRDAEDAWETSLGWLREFRQGTGGEPGRRAREPGTGKLEPRRPSISNWPEADKIRHLKGKTRAHSPRHNETPAWPRAGFGLPIIGRFQGRAREGGTLDEPPGFELHWHRRNERGQWEEHDRLASPLVVKALPLADKTFAPCVLWLNRASPRGDVILKGDPQSASPFDRLEAPGDRARFSALEGKSTLREAFLDWLRETFDTTEVAP